MERFLIELFLRGLLLCLLTALTLVLFRRATAGHRHLVCVLALLLLPLLPLAQRLLPPLRLLPPSSATTAGGETLSPQEAFRFSGLNRKSEIPASPARPQEPIPEAKSSPLLPASSGTAAHGLAPVATASQREHTGKATAVLVALWGLGAAILLIRLLVALFRLGRLEAQSREALLDGVAVRISEQVRTPLTWGIRRRIILLPAVLLTGDRAVCESALRHEQAHLTRWDWMWNLLAEIVCAFCWFQPGVWWLRWRMRLESERACDDRVLLSGIAGPDYAAHLLEIVRSVDTHEVAPAMAHRGGMEERMRHILDGAKPRHTQARWLAVSAPFALALLSPAALRVSARSEEAKLPADRGANTVNPKGAVSRRAKSADPAEKSGTGSRKDGPQGNGSPAATRDDSRPAITLSDVIWGNAVDGLQPGFLPTTPDLPTNRRVSLNTHVTYKVLVRNVTDRKYLFGFRCTKSGPWSSTPYFIPNDAMRDALRSRSTLERFRAIGVKNTASGSPIYGVKLAPGEAVVVPEEFGLTIGDAEKERFPRIEAIKKGLNWILHPITIRPLTSAERAEIERMNKLTSSSQPVVTTIDRDGKTRQVSAPAIGAGARETLLYAGIQLEVGTN